MSDQEAMEIALVENLQRRDLDPMEESSAYFKLIDELGWTQENLSQRIGKSRSHIANYLRLLALNDDIQTWISEGSLSVAHGKYLLSIDEPRRGQLARRAVSEGWTLKQLQDFAERAAVLHTSPEAEDVHLTQTQENLCRLFGTKVRMRGGLDKGRIEIPYHTVDELERILEILHDPERDDPGNFVV
jgi:ParB family chromosome partitioning protein